jgi:hypothetical protein
MSKSTGSRDQLSEAFQDFLGNVAKILLGLGAVATLAATGFLIFTCFRVASDPAVTADAIKNVAILRQVLLYGTIGVAVGASFLFWGEELNSALLLLFAAVLFFAPAWVPLIAGGTNEASAAALSALQHGGAVLGTVSALVLVIDVGGKMRQRAKVGVRADQLKYGKGVKEEKDRQNVFLGKCWQLPYCRKFVRERCPIYHAKRTCWRERVGCMCEEEVIRTAMENKPIPKAQLLDGSAIPRNHRLNEKQKAERCRNCVIYNEHQRHKYKAVIPAVLAFYGLLYFALHAPLAAGITALIKAVNLAIGKATFTNGANLDVPVFFVEGLLFFMILLLLTYTMKLVEFLVFKLKI